MKTRIISGAVLTVILVGAVLGGGTTMFILAAIITALGLYELYKVVGIEKKALGICGYILAASFYTMLWFDKLQYLEYFCVASGILTMFVYVCRFKTTRAKQAAFSLLGIYYVAIPISYIYRIRIMEKGIFIFILVFVCSWIADTFAYFTGVNLGKHKLVPHLSPKKSVEGAIGGILGATIVGVVYGLVLGNYYNERLWPAFAVICVLGSFISIFGDLAASAIKRNYDVKDYSNLIPGHGGILDRFDSMIFVAPVVYISAVILLPLLKG